MTVAMNLFYSYMLFVDDKTSYVFESGLRQAESLNDQVTLEIKELSTYINILKTHVLPKNDFENVLSINEQLIAVGEITSSGNIVEFFKNSKALEREKNKGVFNFNIETGSFLISPNTIRANEIELINFNSTSKAYIYLTKKDAISWYFFLSTADSINEIFKNKNSLFTSFPLKLDSHDTIYADLAAIIKSFPGFKGTLEYETPTHKFYLASFVKSSDGKSALISLMDKDKAFLVTRALIAKTVLFGGFLLGLLIAIGVFFSSALTRPIELLTELADKISKGDFKQKFVVTTKDELAVLGTTFNKMSAEIENLLLSKEDVIKSLEVANLKLEDYGKNLSKMVELRTAELKRANDFMGAMVNSLDQGLMVFDKKLKCHEIHTNACEQLFDISVVGKTFQDILGVKDKSEIETINDWASLMFSEQLPFTSVVPLGPQSKITGMNFQDWNYKNIVLSYHPMRDENKKISNIVVVATDKTKEIQSTELASEREAYVNMAIRILFNKGQFQSFIIEIERLMGQLRLCYNDALNTLDLKTAMLQFHTLNGGFSLYNLYLLQKITKEHESTISQIRSGQYDLQDYQSKFQTGISHLIDTWKKTIIEIDQVLSTNFADGITTKEITYSQIIELKSRIDLADNAELKTIFYNNFIYEPIQNYFFPYDDLIKIVSKTLGKKIRELSIINGELLIDPNPYREFFSVLVHLFRNCLDHGIENESTRISLGKKAEGYIGVAFELCNINNVAALKVTVEDDGAGIDTDKIKKKLESMHPELCFDDLSENELKWKIFDPFFSTRDEISALSGRGVGMSAIREVVDVMGGKIEIESVKEKGSRFTFILPVY
jgi:methyl-accepting chemotaxis protein